MQVDCKKIMPLIDYIKIDSKSVICHFKCPVSGKKVISSVPFEPFDTNIKPNWKDCLFHPVRAYKKYFHTPLVIYAQKCDRSIVLKAFVKVETDFVWDESLNSYKVK